MRCRMHQRQRKLRTLYYSGGKMHLEFCLLVMPYQVIVMAHWLLNTECVTGDQHHPCFKVQRLRHHLSHPTHTPAETLDSPCQPMILQLLAGSAIVPCGHSASWNTLLSQQN